MTNNERSLEQKNKIQRPAQSLTQEKSDLEKEREMNLFIDKECKEYEKERASWPEWKRKSVDYEMDMERFLKLWG